MSDWGWVGFGYAVAYGSLAAYALFLWLRLRGARRRLERLE